jgi:hypothetical protein
MPISGSSEQGTPQSIRTCRNKINSVVTSSVLSGLELLFWELAVPEPIRVLTLTMSEKNSILNSVLVLALIGILSGALGGLAVGLITGRTTSSTSSTSTK